MAYVVELVTSHVLVVATKVVWAVAMLLVNTNVIKHAIQHVVRHVQRYVEMVVKRAVPVPVPVLVLDLRKEIVAPAKENV